MVGILNEVGMHFFAPLNRGRSQSNFSTLQRYGSCMLFLVNFQGSPDYLYHNIISEHRVAAVSSSLEMRYRRTQIGTAYYECGCRRYTVDRDRAGEASPKKHFQI